VRGGAACVDREVDRDRGECAAEACEHGQGEAPAIAQLAEVELAPSLETDDEEEERHQAAVDPAAEIEREARVADFDRQSRRPHAHVRVLVDVHPQERGERRAEQQHGAARLRAQELAQRCRHGASPRRTAGEAWIGHGDDRTARADSAPGCVDVICKKSSVARFSISAGVMDGSRGTDT